jgi:ketosteroid isomerase-like protein
MEPEAQFNEQVLENLERSVIAFNSGDPAFFDSFARDATIFAVDSTEPIQGRDAYRRSYQEILTRDKRQKTITDRTVQIVGDKAVVTQTAEIKQGDLTANIRQTLVCGKTEEGVKVLHAHTALLGAPVTVFTDDGGITRSVAEIRVLSEKIATVATVLGVAQ